jgi:hypothetical protein
MAVLKAFAVWLLILALAIANGALRESLLLKSLPRSAAYTLSGIILIGCVLLASVLLIRWLGQLRPASYWLVGLFWLALTLAFEFSFAWLRGQDPGGMLQAYRFKDGNIWPLVLLVVALAPVLAAWVRGLLPVRGRAGGN